jgi:hypothetical protein
VRLPAALTACLLLAAGCGAEGERAARPPAAVADLRVTVDRDGRGPKAPVTREVRCGAPQDCPKLAAVEVADLAPTPPDVACTELYGGPQTATVSGRLRGEQVDARFSRVNGCEIARWAAAEPILGRAR